AMLDQYLDQLRRHAGQLQELALRLLDGGAQLVGGHDLDVPLDQLRGQPDVLAAAADGGRQLVLLDGEDGPLEQPGEEDLFDGGGLERVLDEDLEGVVPADDVDALDAAELLDDVLDPRAADADAGTDAVHPAVDRGDGHLGPVAGLPGDALDLDGAVL